MKRGGAVSGTTHRGRYDSFRLKSCRNAEVERITTNEAAMNYSSRLLGNGIKYYKDNVEKSFEFSNDLIINLLTLAPLANWKVHCSSLAILFFYRLCCLEKSRIFFILLLFLRIKSRISHSNRLEYLSSLFDRVVEIKREKRPLNAWTKEIW